MRALAVVVTVPVALVAWQWWDDRGTERTLAPVASAVAGRPVAVDCQSVWASLVDALPRHGEVRFSADGVPEPRLFLTHPTCDRLQAFASSRSHDELRCLSTLDWGSDRPLLPGTPCYEEASSTVYALLTLAHEAYHVVGVTNEAATNCYAIQAMAYAAAALGAPPPEAVLVAQAMNALEPLQGGGYGTTQCVAGSELDLHPETPTFPTEQPLAPPGPP
ncbi:MAG: hypothetical protein OEW31_03110 [Thermoleophilia bacterium]|nr:hypothetical protein [Thermoleophilia bacterium]MDH5333663.1 hypothetical protein [Thermoleophilia bacterium]